MMSYYDVILIVSLPLPAVMHGNRTRLRQELEKQRQELERNREEIDARMRREAAVNHQSSSMEVPANRGGASGGNQVTVEVPTTILEVSCGRGVGCDQDWL